MKKKIEFKSDHRSTNLKLHYFYVRTALKQLALIEQLQRRLSDESNLNMSDMAHAIENEKQRLIKEDAAFFEANDILEELKAERVMKVVRIKRHYHMNKM